MHAHHLRTGANPPIVWPMKLRAEPLENGMAWKDRITVHEMFKPGSKIPANPHRCVLSSLSHRVNKHRDVSLGASPDFLVEFSRGQCAKSLGRRRYFGV